MPPYVVVLALLLLGASAPSSDAALRDALVGMSHQHMAMTPMHGPQTGDRERAAAVVAVAKSVLQRFPTVESAVAAGYNKFLPLSTLPVEHYVNGKRLSDEQAGRIDPAQPSSLLFERTAHGLKPIAVMYLAPPEATEAQLDAVVPLSVTRWHRHVDLCFAPGDDLQQKLSDDPRFGFAGTVVGETACHAAGGTWMPAYLGWMVHVWPNERNPWGTVSHDDASMHGMKH